MTMDEKIEEIFACLKDNEEAHVILNELVVKIGKRLQQLEEAMQEMPTPDKTYFRPPGTEDYFTLAQNLNHIYERLEKIENAL